MVKQFYDIVVIGAGPAGIECAKKLAENGKQVALIDRGIGGNYCFAGSVISNLLLRISYLYERTVGRCTNFLEFEWDKIPTFDFKKAKKFMEGVVAKTVKNFSDELVDAGVIILKGTAVFEDDKTLKVTDDKMSFVVGFNKLIIAAGSVNLSSNVPSTKKLIDTTNIFELAAAPKSIIIVGGGFIGTEFATIFRRMGCIVTIVEKTDKILASVDRQVVKEYEEQLKKNGVEILKEVSVEKIEKVGNKTIVFLDNDTKIEAEEVFVAIGRKPNLCRLAPEKAGVRCYDNGLPKLTKKLRTSNRNIYVVGDATGVNMFVNWSYMSADIVVSDILEQSKSFSSDYCPRILHLDPEMASVGILEETAKDQKIDYKVLRHNFKNFENSMLNGSPKGFIKIIYEEIGKKILGCHAVGSGASELVSFFSMMIQSRIPMSRLDEFVFNHPTYSGVLGEIAGKVK